MELGFRAYLYKQHGASALIAGSLPNFVAVVLLSLLFVLRRDGEKNSSSLKLVAMAVAAMVLYELVQPLIDGRTFDFNDIIASVMGGVFIYLLLALVDYLKPQR